MKATMIDPTTVTTALENWKTTRQTPELLIELLSGIEWFSFYYQIEDKTPMHIYPGLTRDDAGKSTLVFYAIPECYDSATENPFEHVQECTPVRPSKDKENYEPIPDGIAAERIENWRTNFRDWVLKQKEGIFEAFYIPVDDFDPLRTKDGVEQQTGSILCKAHLALKFELNPIVSPVESQSLVELIISRNNDLYYDTVRPVPPFKPYKAYLLGLEQP